MRKLRKELDAHQRRRKHLVGQLEKAEETEDKLKKELFLCHEKIQEISTRCQKLEKKV